MFDKKQNSNASGVGHWLLQRVMAVALILLFIWLLFFLSQIAALDSKQTFALLRKPANALGLFFLVTIGLYHGALGAQVIVEDYIANIGLRKAIASAIFVFTGITCFLFVLALLKHIYLFNN